MKAYLKNIYQTLSSIMTGMKITFSHIPEKSVTIQYPEQRLQLPERERNRLYVNMEDCIGCDQCAKACPVSCIDIETFKAVPGDIVGKTGVTSNGKKKALFVPKFTIDFAKCCFCQLCVFPCPTDCIYMTDVFEYSVFKRDGLLYEFTDMTPEMTLEKKNKLAEYQAEQERKKAEAAAEKASAPKEETPKVDVIKIEVPKPEVPKEETPKPEDQNKENKTES